ncbi:MAG: holo-ACP synthase [Eubacteriales bacterium]|nr:holo-ACP synthase [Eubacteriales bacterium]
MNVIGVGTDIVEINRIEKAVNNEHLLNRVFTNNERDYASSKHNPFQTYAGMFAAKEAAVKAMGGVIDDYEILHNSDGKPYLYDKKAFLSISHCDSYAVAFVIAYTE